MCIALKAFEKFCLDVNLSEDSIDKFRAYMWDFPMALSEDRFLDWEEAKPILVNYGLGDELPNQIESTLSHAQVDESKFRIIVEGVVAILWGSFWGAAEHEQSLRSLISVVTLSGTAESPILTPFKFSRFADKDGWGIDLTAEDRDFWRECCVYA